MFFQGCSSKDRNSGYQCTSTLLESTRRAGCVGYLQNTSNLHLDHPGPAEPAPYFHRWRLRIHDLSQSLSSGRPCPWAVEVFVEVKWYFQGRELQQDDLLKRHPPLTTTQMSDIRVLIIKHSAADWISRTWFNHESFNSQGWNLLLLHLPGAASHFPSDVSCTLWSIIDGIVFNSLLMNLIQFIYSDTVSVTIKMLSGALQNPGAGPPTMQQFHTHQSRFYNYIEMWLKGWLLQQLLLCRTVFPFTICRNT